MTLVPFNDFTEDPFPVYDTPGDIAASEVTLTGRGTTGPADLQAFYDRNNMVFVDPRDFGWVGDGAHDDGPSVEAAIDYALDTGGIVLIPGVAAFGSSSAGTRIGTTIDLDATERGGDGRSNLVIWGAASPNFAGTGHGHGAMAPILGPGGGNPIFRVSGYANPWFQGLNMENAGPCIQTGGTDEASVVSFPNCTMTSTRSGDAPLTIYNSFWVTVGTADARSSLTAPDASTPCVRVVQDSSLGGQAMSNHTYQNLILNKGRILVEVKTADSSRPRQFTLKNITTEAFVDTALVHVKASGPAANTLAMDLMSLEACSHADQTGDCPLVMVEDALVGGVTLKSCDPIGSPYPIKMVGAGARVFGASSDTTPVATTAKALLGDGTNPRGDFVGGTWTGFDYVVRTVNTGTALTDREGNPMRVGVDGEAHVSYFVDERGGHNWGPGGASGGIDVRMARTGVSGVKFTQGALIYRITDTFVDHTLDLTDQVVEMEKATPQVLTIPTHASVAFPIGTKIDVIQTGAGQITVTPAGGVFTLAPHGLKSSAQYGVISLIKRSNTQWYVYGDTTP